MMHQDKTAPQLLVMEMKLPKNFFLPFKRMEESFLIQRPWAKILKAFHKHGIAEKTKLF